MLIKAGIIVSAAAATLLAVSPLAFAGDYDGGKGDGKGHHKSDKDHGKKKHDRDRDHKHDRDRDRDRDHKHDGDRDRDRDGGTDCDQDNSSNHRGGGRSGGLINLSNINVQVPVQLCGNDIASGVLGVLSGDQSNRSND